MEKLNGTFLLATLAFAWAVSASAEMAMSWTGERQGVARAAVAGEGAKDAGAAEGTPEENAPVTQEEYLATVAWVEGEAAVDELSRRMVDDLLGPEHDGEESRYGESTLPGGGCDEALPGGVKVTRGWAGSGGAAAVGGGDFSAADSAENYAGITDWADMNGGSGFGAWQEKLSGRVSVERTVADGSFKMQAGEQSGEIAMVRPLETSQGLERGEFSVTMWGAIGGADESGAAGELSDFAGFAVYGSGGSELFRWGVGSDENGTQGFVYRMVGDDDYTVILENLPAAEVDYTLTWELVGGKTRFSLSATDMDAQWPYFSNREVELGTSAQVMAIAALLTESGRNASEGDGSAMTFDNLRVRGEEPTPAVPEPGVLGLLAAGLAALFRRKATK